MVLQELAKLRPSGHPGSIPGVGVVFFENGMQNIKRI